MTHPLRTGMVARCMAWLQAVLLACALGVPQVMAADTEYRVKAAFLYNFARFVHWPVAVDNTFRLCVVGENPFGDAIDSLTGKNVRGNILVVEHHPTADNLEECQVVYIDASMAAELDALMDALRGRPVLTVSDIDRFVQTGGMIGFRLVDSRVRFDVNIRAANNAELSISSKLLSLASDVITEQAQ